MSRVIKFRAWDLKEMRYDVTGLEYGVENEMSGAFLDGNYYAISNFNGDIYSKTASIMQFTGLHDVNGVEIYEGDIVSVSGIGNAEIKICQCYGVCYKVSGKHGYTELPYIDCAAENDYPTIIGNIHQNPELFNQ